MVPSVTLETGQPWWVQIAEKARMSPWVGCVTTTFWSAKTVPPPTGMSEVAPRSAPEAPDPPVAPEPGDPSALPPPQAASSGSPRPTVAAPVSARRRLSPSVTVIPFRRAGGRPPPYGRGFGADFRAVVFFAAARLAGAFFAAAFRAPAGGGAACAESRRVGCFASRPSSIGARNWPV